MDHGRVMIEPAAVSEPGTAVTHPASLAPPVGEATPAVAGSGQMVPSAGEQPTAVTQALPVALEPCSQCSAPLAPDQRYCLQCGAPRAHVSGPMAGPRAGGSASQLTGPGGGQAPPGVPSTPPGMQPRAPLSPAQMPGRSNTLALLAGIGVLLLAMGVGVLIGRAGAGSPKAPPAQVISVGGSSGGSVAPTTSTPTTQAPTTPAPNTKEAAKAKESTTPGSSITKPAPPSSAKNLRSGKSGQSYEQKSKNLPNVVGT